MWKTIFSIDFVISGKIRIFIYKLLFYELSQHNDRKRPIS